MRYGARLKPKHRLSCFFFAIPLLIVGFLVAIFYTGYRVLFAPRPKIALAQPFETVGRKAPLVLDVREPKFGLGSVQVTIGQGTDEHVIFEQSYDPPQREVSVRWMPIQESRFRLREGPGVLRVRAQSARWHLFSGKTALFQKDFTARLTAPRLEVLTTQHYVNQGGCDMVVYKVTPPSAESGVVVGEAFFRGFPLPAAQDPSLHFALFAYPYDAAPGTQVRLRARDDASNESLAAFWIKIFPKTFRTREIELEDTFLNKVVPEILSQTPSLQDQGDLLKNYLMINRDLRHANNGALRELTQRSKPQFLWHQPFAQLTNSQVEAQFADHRIYKYKGQEVDRQDHLGYDLATTSNAPAAAANDGVVVLAEYFGIYGNTIVIDHGYGLMSLYGHLSSFAVAVGDSVKRGQTIGQTGATGLAGGDHLHFSMILQGVQIDAREWWDPHWIQDRIQLKLRNFTSVPNVSPVGPSPKS